MRNLWMFFLALLSVVGAGSAAAKEPKDYTGADGGYLIYSVGTIRIGMDFSFNYGRVVDAEGKAVQDWPGVIEPRLGGAWTLKIKQPDFADRETGHVIVRRLPPGRYAITDFGFGGQMAGGGSVQWSPTRPFSMPFEIRAGEATYVGSFMRAPSNGTALQAELGAVGFFVVADRGDRDLPIAKAKLASLPDVRREVTDVSELGSAILRSAEP